MTGTKITLGGLLITAPTEAITHASILLWGAAGTGKSTLAMTAPGDILNIQFDQTGAQGVSDIVKNAGEDCNIYVARFNQESDNVVTKFTSPDPIGIEKFLTENPNIKTVVFDSLTSFGDKALAFGVTKARATPKGRTATLEDPGYSGYGHKRTYVEQCVRNLAVSCAKHNVNVIFIAHEGPPTVNNEGVVTERTLLLGASLNITIPKDIGEIWYLADTGKERRLYIRNSGPIRPMRSRIFYTENVQHFKLNFDADKWSGTGIADWLDAWKANGFKKINPPKE